MALRSGLAAQLGVAPETVYGTYVPGTSFAQGSKYDIDKVKNTVVPAGITTGALGPLAAWRRVTTTGGKGTIEMSCLNKKMGPWLQALMGTTVTPVVQGASIAYLQTHILADPYGKSLSVQLGVPDASAAGVVQPYTATGVKVTDGEFTVETAKEVIVKWGIDAKSYAGPAETGTQTLAAASIVTTRPFVGTDAAFKIGATYGAETATTGVKKVSVKFDRGLAVDRNYLGAGGLKAEPFAEALTKITGTITADLMDRTVFADRFVNDTMFYMVIEIVGAVISATYFDTLRITLPGCFLNGNSPRVDGVGVVSGDFPFEWNYDGTNLPKIEYISTDVTI